MAPYCDGRPHGPSDDLGAFGVSSSEKLSHQGRASLDDGGPRQPSTQNGEAVPGNAKAALGEYGGISSATKSTSLDVAGREVDITDGGPASPANYKG